MKVTLYRYNDKALVLPRVDAYVPDVSFHGSELFFGLTGDSEAYGREAPLLPDISMTPDEARKLACRLIVAAEEAEA